MARVTLRAMSQLTFSRATAALVAVAALYGAAGVATAAAAAHRVDDPSLGTASTFLMIHALAILVLVAVAGAYGAGRLLTVPAGVIAIGVLLFSGSLILKVFLGASPLPAAAPVGGALLIVGWLAAAAGAVAHGVRRGRSAG